MIIPYQPSHFEAVAALAERAWTPVFPSIEQTLLPEVYAAFYPKGWQAHHRESVETVCNDADTPVWVAMEGDTVAGFVGLKFHDDDKMGEIYIIGVDPEFQGRGIGVALSNFAEARMKEAGMKIAMVETGGDPGHAPARATYEKVGYKLWPVARYFKALD